MKWYHILIAFILGLLLGAFGYSFWPSPETNIEDPIIHQLREGIEWRSFKESKLKDSLKFERKEKIVLAKENIELRAIANKAIDRYKAVNKAIPVTHKDTIVFLMRDTLVCDSALLRQNELIKGLTKEGVVTDSLLKTMELYTWEVLADKKDLVKVDSLNQIDKKQLRKEARRKARRAFFKGAGIGGAIVAILIAVF